MNVTETLTKLVVGTSRFGDHLLKKKLSGIIVATLAFACGAGLTQALRDEPVTPPTAVIRAKPADPARAEVSIRDTPAGRAADQSSNR